jgi:putative ABC transport system permease protein
MPTRPRCCSVDAAEKLKVFMLRWRRRIPLAWANLRHSSRRLLTAAGGIGFAVLLFFMQLGFQGALYDSTVQVPIHLNADLVIFNRNKTTITVKNTFSRQRLYVARACPGVAAAYPLYMDNRFSWKSAGQGRSYAIRALAFNPTQPVLTLPEVVGQVDKLLLPDTVLFDRLSKSDYGYPRPGDRGQFAGDQVDVVGMFSLGTDFANDGNLVMSDITYVGSGRSASGGAGANRSRPGAVGARRRSPAGRSRAGPHAAARRARDDQGRVCGL